MPRLLALVLTAAAALTVEEELDAAYPCFSEAIALRATCSCATIDLSNRGLQGTIPPTLALCEDLSALDLRGNGIVGTIPEALSALPRLSRLGLSNNRLTGAIPSIARSVTHLSLHHNNLTGTIPRAIGALASLNYLCVPRARARAVSYTHLTLPTIPLV